jgi:hypothetical protein
MRILKTVQSMGQDIQNSLPFAFPIGQSSIVTIYPANGWQNVTYAGKTAQITGRADKAWAVAHADLFCMGSD